MRLRLQITTGIHADIFWREKELPTEKLGDNRNEYHSPNAAFSNAVDGQESYMYHG